MKTVISFSYDDLDLIAFYVCAFASFSGVSSPRFP